MHPILTRRTLGALSLAALAAPRTGRTQARVVRIGFASIGAGNRQFAGSGSPVGHAHAEGILDRDLAPLGFEIRWFFFAGAGPAVNEALANNQLDIALQGDLPAVIGRANGLKTKLIMANGIHVPVYLAVAPDSDIKSVRDLKGRTVAWHRGTNLHLAIVKVLAANGLTERDLKVVNMDFAAADAALASRNVDAQFGSATVLALQRRGLARIAYTTKGDNPAFGRHSHMLVQESFAAENPELVARIVRTSVRVADWASDEANREALFASWARSGHPVENFRDDFEGQALAHRNSPVIDDFLRRQYQVQAEQALEYRLVRRAVDTAGWWDTRYVDAALAELNLGKRWIRRDAEGREVAA